jgi:hypothetical protein
MIFGIKMRFACPAGELPRISDGQRFSFRSILKRADPPAIRLYDLRHSVAKGRHSAGVNVEVVLKNSAHDSINLMLTLYARDFSSWLQRIVVAVAIDSPVFHEWANPRDNSYKARIDVACGRVVERYTQGT